jgi:hypothetical protein
MAFRGEHVLTISNNTGVSALDVTDPAAPTVVGAGYDHGGYTIVAAASRAYVNSDFVGGGVKVLDVRDVQAPTLAGELAPAGGADMPLVAGSSLYSIHDGLELHRHEREPMLAERHVSGAAGADLTYTVTWLDATGGDDHRVKCRATGGACAVESIDQGGNSAAVRWALPDAAGDHELRIAVGNGHYFGTVFDRVQVR